MIGGGDREGLISRVHHSLITHDLRGGVPRRLAIMNGTLTAAMVQGTRFYWLILVGVGIHVGAYFLAKRDPEFFEVFIRYMKTARLYDI